jgi:hypothetical protein
MFRKVSKITGLKSKQRIPKKKVGFFEKKDEQLEIDFDDAFKKIKPKPRPKLIIKKLSPQENLSKTISNFLRANNIEILSEFLKSEISSATKERKFGKRSNLEKILAHIEVIKKKEEEIDWAQKQQKRHYQDRDLNRELNDDIFRYKSDIGILEKQIINSMSSLFRASYPKNFAANNVESVILREYFLSKNKMGYQKYTVLKE